MRPFMTRLSSCAVQLGSLAAVAIWLMPTGAACQQVVPPVQVVTDACAGDEDAARKAQAKKEADQIQALRKEIAELKETVKEGANVETSGPPGTFYLNARSASIGKLIAGGKPLFDLTNETAALLVFDTPRPKDADVLGLVVKDNLLVSEVKPGSYAELIGIRSGDLVGEINGQELDSKKAFEDATRKAIQSDHERFVITIYRAGS